MVISGACLSHCCRLVVLEPVAQFTQFLICWEKLVNSSSSYKSFFEGFPTKTEIGQLHFLQLGQLNNKLEYHYWDSIYILLSLQKKKKNAPNIHCP